MNNVSFRPAPKASVDDYRLQRRLREYPEARGANIDDYIDHYRMTNEERRMHRARVDERLASRPKAVSEIARERMKLIGYHLNDNVEAVSKKVGTVFQSVGRFFQAIWDVLPSEEVDPFGPFGFCSRN